MICILLNRMLTTHISNPLSHTTNFEINSRDTIYKLDTKDKKSSVSPEKETKK